MEDDVKIKKNKFERKQIEAKKFKKRKTRIREKGFNIEEDNFCYKKQATPCSCPLCKGEKYTRKTKHKTNFIPDIEEDLDKDFDDLEFQLINKLYYSKG